MIRYGITQHHIDGVVLHFAGPSKPWETDNLFYAEWKNNFDVADTVDLRTSRNATRFWTDAELESYQLFIDTQHFEYTIWFVVDRSLGNLGKAVRWCSPRLYNLMKRLIVG